MAIANPPCARYYQTLMQALRDKIIPEKSLPEARRRLKLARQELAKKSKHNWCQIFSNACEWIKTIEVVREVRITTHNYVLEEPWWIDKT